VSLRYSFHKADSFLMQVARGLRHRTLALLGRPCSPVRYCWLRIVTEITSGISGIQVVPFEPWFHFAGQLASSDRAPLCPAYGGVPANLPSGTLTWEERAH
jgi:hypothetical protein